MVGLGLWWRFVGGENGVLNGQQAPQRGKCEDVVLVIVFPW